MILLHTSSTEQLWTFWIMRLWKDSFWKVIPPRITYKKTNGETVILSIYKLSDAENSVNNTLWVFARDWKIAWQSQFIVVNLLKFNI